MLLLAFGTLGLDVEHEGCFTRSALAPAVRLRRRCAGAPVSGRDLMCRVRS